MIHPLLLIGISLAVSAIMFGIGGQLLEASASKRALSTLVPIDDREMIINVSDATQRASIVITCETSQPALPVGGLLRPIMAAAIGSISWGAITTIATASSLEGEVIISSDEADRVSSFTWCDGLPSLPAQARIVDIWKDHPDVEDMHVRDLSIQFDVSSPRA